MRRSATVIYTGLGVGCKISPCRRFPSPTSPHAPPLLCLDSRASTLRQKRHHRPSRTRRPQVACLFPWRTPSPSALRSSCPRGVGEPRTQANSSRRRRRDISSRCPTSKTPRTSPGSLTGRLRHGAPQSHAHFPSPPISRPRSFRRTSQVKIEVKWTSNVPKSAREF
ncbi:hypothetical protein BD626DRAFT_516733 [Schizophyllum amplum]|uniref:Uncharacterized protein n=1 Tax=Schizophyllum amplum TaxID=97359 RepID=A0A550BWZ1_9AGAR|nr:hypothetical protein BD626DRAFT_516733 [Auriculariopsis ampla]